MPFVPSVVKRAAVAAGFPDTQEGYAEYMASLKAAAAPRNLGTVSRHEPRHTRSSSNRRRRSAIRRRSAGGKSGVTHRNRRVRINMNTGAAVDEVHPKRVDPMGRENVDVAYRSELSRPVTNFAGTIQRRRRELLRRVLTKRKALGSRISFRNAALLGRIVAAVNLTDHNAEDLAALRERFDDLLDS